MNKKPNLQRGILSTTHVDSHGERMSSELLEEMKNSINSNSKMRWGLDHNRLFPPLGRLANADVVKKNDYYYLEADYEPFENRQEVSWDPNLIIESFEIESPFVEITRELYDEDIISVDPNSFASANSYNAFYDELDAIDYPFDLSENLRKADVPLPELLITVGKSAILYHLIKPTIKKVGEKIADEIAEKAIEKGKEFYNYINLVIRAAFRHATQPNRPLVTIFELTGIPNVELVAKTDDYNIVLKAIKKERLKNICKEVAFYESKFNVEKIQFILNEKGKWKFTYLLTAEGAVVGKKEVFKKRDHRYTILDKATGGNFNNSIGLTRSRKRRSITND